ncbi:putative ABC transporter ATP-binding protein [Kineosphaera limosa NBRC 100340]|uniref:Putative ABC transporter ATP-binding protein n=1 Tax=Kineosphaera limosa NBRC 100340 TaxID=1184609 RepID=K6WTQ2_9MICO|nr:ABC transporter ATP-binding protein [Kineosphaera limosa]GAB95487.1 putative ABC transporter ATP-binding protein [Kineosphaera limosa NBRC 100340]
MGGEPASEAHHVISAGSPIVQTQSLTMDFGRVVALLDLDVRIGGGVTGLVGANGAGKSTLIKILLGLLKPTSGTATVLGFDIASESAQIRRLVGYMPEHDCLPPDVSASDFVVHLGRMSGLPAAVARERAADVLRHVGLAEERYRPMGGYSTGMKQRAKLAQALVHDPRLVFLDEPTNGLDPAARDDMLRLVRRIGHDFGIAVVVTSHLLGELERVSDHVIVLDGGRLLRASATSEFLEGTGGLLIEVLGGLEDRDAMVGALSAAGLTCQPRGAMIGLDPAPQGFPVHDLIRDTAASLDLGLVRIQADHRRLEDVFADRPDTGSDPSDARDQPAPRHQEQP